MWYIHRTKTSVYCLIQRTKSTCLWFYCHGLINMLLVHTPDQDCSLLSYLEDQISMPMVHTPVCCLIQRTKSTRLWCIHRTKNFVVSYRGPNQHACGAYTGPRTLLSHPEDQINMLVVHTQDQELCCLIQRTKLTCLWCIHRTKTSISCLIQRTKSTCLWCIHRSKDFSLLSHPKD